MHTVNAVNKIENTSSFKSGWRESYTLHLADNALILAHRNSEWCGHGPVLEQDIAITNISLDLIGQARNFYQYAAEIIRARVAEYKIKTFVVAEYYEQFKKVVTVNGEGSIEDIFNALCKEIDARINR